MPSKARFLCSMINCFSEGTEALDVPIIGTLYFCKEHKEQIDRISKTIAENLNLDSDNDILASIAENLKLDADE